MTNHSRKPLYIIIILSLLFFGPLLLAWHLFHHQPAWLKNTVNYGQLIQPPIPFNTFHFKHPNGTPVTNKEYQGKWLMLYITPSPCATRCLDNLYKMRQVRLALGKDSERVQRLAALTTSKPDQHLQTLLAKEYSGTELIMSTIAIDKESLYLVDPLGNVILVYPADAALRGLYNDLTRLLKVSNIG